MTKQKLKEIITKISSMDKQELIAYSQEVYMSKPDIAEKAFGFIERGLDIRMMQLQEVTELSPMVVLSELKEGEV